MRHRRGGPGESAAFGVAVDVGVVFALPYPVGGG